MDAAVLHAGLQDNLLAPFSRRFRPAIPSSALLCSKQTSQIYVDARIVICFFAALTVVDKIRLLERLGLPANGFFKLTTLIDPIIKFYPDSAIEKVRRAFSPVWGEEDLDVSLAEFFCSELLYWELCVTVVDTV